MATAGPPIPGGPKTFKQDVERKLFKEYGRIAQSEYVSLKLVGTALDRLWGNRNQRRKEAYRDFQCEISELDGQALIDYFEARAPKVLGGVSLRDMMSGGDSSDDLRSTPPGQDADVEDAMRLPHPVQSAWRSNWGLRLSPPGGGATSAFPRPQTSGSGAGRKSTPAANRKGEGRAGSGAGKSATSRGKGESLRAAETKPTQGKGRAPAAPTVSKAEAPRWEHGELCRDEWTVRMIQQDEVMGAESGVALMSRNFFYFHAHDMLTSGAVAAILPGDKEWFRDKSMCAAVNARLDAAERVSFLCKSWGGGGEQRQQPKEGLLVQLGNIDVRRKDSEAFTFRSRSFEELTLEVYYRHVSRVARDEIHQDLRTFFEQAVNRVVGHPGAIHSYAGGAEQGGRTLSSRYSDSAEVSKRP